MIHLALRFAVAAGFVVVVSLWASLLIGSN